MNDDRKTREQLIDELNELRRRVGESPVWHRDADGGWETLCDAIGSAIWLLDDQFRICRTNRTAETMFQIPKDKLIGRHCWEIVHQSHQPIPRCPVLRAMRSKKREQLDVPIGERWFEVTVDVATDASGTVIGYLHVVADITARKRAEEQLQMRERQLRALLESSTESMFLIDTEGRVIEANQCTAARLNVERSALNKHTMYDLLPAEVAQQRARHVERLIETKEAVQFVDERRGRTMLNSLHPVIDNDGRVTHVAVFGRDITEERAARQAIEENRRQLEEMNAMLQLVIDTIPVRLFWKDQQSVYLGCNAVFARDAGRERPAQVVGESDGTMPWRDQAEAYVADDQAVMTSGTAKVNFEEPQNTPTGQRIWLRTTKVPLRDAAGNVTGVLGTYEDITEHKVLEQRIRESEERYRSLFANSQATMLVIDPTNGKIVDANAAAARYYGYSIEELTTMSIAQINTLCADEIFAEMARAKAEQRNHFFFFHRLASGEIRAVESYSGPIRLGGRDLLYSIVHDISARRKAEEEREHLILELREALARIKTLSGMLPICASCKKIRNDDGYWEQIEVYIKERSEAEFSHGICPECIKKLYPELAGRMKEKKGG